MQSYIKKLFVFYKFLFQITDFNIKHKIPIAITRIKYM